MRYLLLVLLFCSSTLFFAQEGEGAIKPDRPENFTGAGKVKSLNQKKRKDTIRKLTIEDY